MNRILLFRPSINQKEILFLDWMIAATPHQGTIDSPKGSTNRFFSALKPKDDRLMVPEDPGALRPDQTPGNR